MNSTEIKAAVGIGDKLANGATVLAVRPYSSWPKDGVVFLALWRDELVTWVGRADGTDTMWGHYLGDDIADAVADWQTR